MIYIHLRTFYYFLVINNSGAVKILQRHLYTIRSRGIKKFEYTTAALEENSRNIATAYSWPRYCYISCPSKKTLLFEIPSPCKETAADYGKKKKIAFKSFHFYNDFIAVLRRIASIKLHVNTVVLHVRNYI